MVISLHMPEDHTTTDFWAHLDEVPSERKMEVFLAFATLVIEQTSAGDMSRKMAAKRLAPGWDVTELHANSDVTIALDLAIEIGGGFTSSTEEEGGEWQELVINLTRAAHAWNDERKPMRCERR